MHDALMCIFNVVGIVKLMLEQANIMLREMLGSEEMVERWWHTQNWHFKLEKPDIVLDYDPSAVYDFILLMYSKKKG